jgi:hypothetical protein
MRTGLYAFAVRRPLCGGKDERGPLRLMRWTVGSTWKGYEKIILLPNGENEFTLIKILECEEIYLSRSENTQRRILHEDDEIQNNLINKLTTIIVGIMTELRLERINKWPQSMPFDDDRSDTDDTGTDETCILEVPIWNIGRSQ